jgi:hypothetical protein
MRIAWLLLIALLIGCQAHIFATGAQGEVKFSFDRLIKPRAIVVFEIENRQRGRLALLCHRTTVGVVPAT